MADIQDLSITDDNNIGRWPENMPFSGVNNAGRADEGLMARWYQDMNGSLTSSGSSNAYALTSNRTISTLANNTVVAFTPNHSNTGAATLALNGLTAKPIVRLQGSAVAANDLVSGSPVTVVYKTAADAWFLLTPPASISGFNQVYNDQTGTTYTLLSSDTNKILRFTNSSNVTVTCPDNLSKGWTATILQSGTGRVIFSAGGGASVNNRRAHDRTSGQYAMVILTIESNGDGNSASYVLGGDTDV